MDIRKKLESLGDVEIQRIIIHMLMDEQLLKVYDSGDSIKKHDIFKIADFMLSMRLFQLFFEFMNIHSFHSARKGKKVFKAYFHI